ncbi:MAG: sulfate ABC transporter substrate-binding protein [Pseudomonadales bacterium]|nr:sulfate ABC transporter substrate-binding protein [Pseudomonadales bacterium]
MRTRILPLLALLALTAAPLPGRTDTIQLLNVSYDPTREFYQDFNAAFARHWEAETGDRVVVRQSHGGSGSQARAVIDGLDADVVTLALAADIDAIAERTGKIPADWQQALPRNSAPYQSTLAFLVRKGNPKNIRSWEDLARDGIEVITPNPKTSGVARWNYLALWGYALHRALGPDFAARLADPAAAEAVARAQAEAEAFVARVYRNVPVLDSGARGATNTFIQRRLGDVLINWENEILLGAREIDEAGLEVIVPPVSILAEPVVAVVEGNARRRGTEAVARAYLAYLYSEVGQELAARHYYRPSDPDTAARYAERFPTIELFTIDAVFGGWRAANAAHFADGASFDRIFAPGRR